MKHRRIGQVMTEQVVSVRPQTPFKEVAGLLGRHRVSGLPVVDADDRVVGVVSESDLLQRQALADVQEPRRRLWRSRAARAAGRKAAALTAGELMSAPAVTVRADESVARAARTMTTRRIERLPVVDGEGRLVGIATRRDLLRVFLRSDEDIRKEVIDEVLVRSLWLMPQEVGVRVKDGVVTLEGRVDRESEVHIAGRMTEHMDGVVGVHNLLTARFDDSHLRPVQPGGNGVVRDR
ncbi:CBS domain-containing protein [Streptomyces sp. HPF1205]|uniref:CBS domain-containing protein n=1 Tax=Streptomyces sp. HPF1205 TaxID=2873262 RepID=UPI001CEC8400|nr:CBS domain-containing protein [Streptomyces sp. HPF1205]